MTRRARGLAGTLGCLGLALAAAWACGTSPVAVTSGAACASAPSQCPSGTTCWPANASADLECLPSLDAGTFGVVCKQVIGAPTCGSGLACDQLGPEAGTCTYYCGGTASACPRGYGCDLTNVGGANGPTIELCRKAPEAGADTGVQGENPDADDGIVAPEEGGSPSDANPAMR